MPLTQKLVEAIFHLARELQTTDTKRSVAIMPYHHSRYGIFSSTSPLSAVSMPLLPSSVSVPVRPSSLSSPSPPNRKLLAVLPISVSLPEPPITFSKNAESPAAPTRTLRLSASRWSWTPTKDSHLQRSITLKNPTYRHRHQSLEDGVDFGCQRGAKNILIVSCPTSKRIVTATTVQRVVASASIKCVVACTANKQIVSQVATKRIVSSTTKRSQNSAIDQRHSFSPRDRYARPLSYQFAGRH